MIYFTDLNMLFESLSFRKAKQEVKKLASCLFLGCVMDNYIKKIEVNVA